MTNFEKYKEEIQQAIDNDEVCKFVEKMVLKSDELCSQIRCVNCQLRTVIWLNEECKEPEVDWSQVAVDTPILVRDYENDPWYKRHFAEYKDGLIWAYGQGTTSWSTAGELMMWRMGKLAEEGDIK